MTWSVPRSSQPVELPDRTRRSHADSAFFAGNTMPPCAGCSASCWRSPRFSSPPPPSELGLRRGRLSLLADSNRRQRRRRLPGGARVSRSESVYDPDLIWRPSAADRFRRSIPKGSAASRSHPTNRQHARRIIAIGDSNTFGWDVDDGANWPAQLQTLFTGNAADGSDQRRRLGLFVVSGRTTLQGIDLAQSRRRPRQFRRQ